MEAEASPKLFIGQIPRAWNEEQVRARRCGCFASCAP
jgi:hypothetical protein